MVDPHVRAIGVMEFGGPEVLKEVEVPDPRAGSGEIGIRVHAAAVNPTDTVLRSGVRAQQLRDVAPPHVPGMDAAGVVDEIGPGVATDLAVGDHVMAIVAPRGAHGAYAERVVVPAASVVRVPRGATDVEAATLPMNALTVRQALDLLALSPGQALGVTGAAGAVGGYAIELAKADGLRVIADASAADTDMVRQLGADVVVPRGQDVATRMRIECPEGLDGLVDGAVLDQEVAPALRDGGRVATVRGFEGPGERGLTFHPVWVRSALEEHDKLDRLRRQAEEGILTLRVAHVLPAAQAAEAHRLLERGGVRGRLVLEF